MFREISIISLIVCMAAVIIHSIKVSLKKRKTNRHIGIIRKITYLFTLLSIDKRGNAKRHLRKLFYLACLCCLTGLATTAFYQKWFKNENLTGFFLVVHVSLGGVFAACLSAVIVMSAHNNRFNKNYLPSLAKIFHFQTDSGPPADRYEFIRKILFWLLIVLSFPLFLSVILAMFKFFGTEWQRFLEEVHRYTALIFLEAAIFHTYFFIRAKMNTV